MNRISAIFKREFLSYFRSPMGYVLIAIFMAISGLYFGISISSYSYSSISDELGLLQYILFIFIPIITMRAFSEDRKNGTEVLLFTSPANTLEIVLAKYLACLAIFLLMTATTLIHLLLTLALGGLIDIGVLGAYIAFTFLGAAFIAVGVFASALTENQIIAAVVAAVILLVLMLISAVAGVLGNGIATIAGKLNFFGWLSDTQIASIATAVSDGLNWLSPNARINNFISGIFEITPIVYFLSLIAVFLFLTNQIIEKRRWSQR